MIYWITVYFFKAFFRVFYRHRVFGSANIPMGAAVIAPNHVSHFDPPVISISIREEVHFLAKESLFRAPILGQIISCLNAYPVKGSAQDLSSFKLLSRLLHEEKKVCIFPEGARSFDGELASLQLGVAMIALRCDAPIVPAYIQGTYEVFPRTQTFSRLWGKTACYFGKPIHPKDYAGLSKKEAQVAITEDLRKALVDLRELSQERSSR